MTCTMNSFASGEETLAGGQQAGDNEPLLQSGLESESTLSSDRKRVRPYVEVISSSRPQCTQGYLTVLMLASANLSRFPFKIIPRELRR